MLASAIITGEAFTSEDSYSSPFSQADFVPDIALILDFSAVYRNLDNETFEGTELPAFIHAHGDEDDGHGHSHENFNASRGFNLNYGELSFFSAVDPYFNMFAALHLSPESAALEEIYVTSQSLPAGLQVTLGKFRSAIGRLNSQHAHYWNFADAPLVYMAFFGQEGLNEIGVRATVLTPLPFYLELGGEVLSGDNASSFGSDGFEVNERKEDGNEYPDLYTGFMKTSIDAGNLTVVLGGSLLRGQARINHDVEEADGHAVYGKTWIFGGDLAAKYFIDSYRYIALQGEYLYRMIDGNKYTTNTAGDTTIRQDLEKNQSGLYAELIIKPSLRWRIGGRYGLLKTHHFSVASDSVTIPADTLQRYSGMIEFNPSHFSRFRLQYNNDRSRYSHGERKINHEVILQCNMAIGAHGAHSF